MQQSRGSKWGNEFLIRFGGTAFPRVQTGEFGFSMIAMMILYGRSKHSTFMEAFSGRLF